MASLQRDLDDFKSIVTGLLRRFEKGSKTSNELQTLYDATATVQVALLHPEFRRRSDATRLAGDISSLTDLASTNLQELQVLVSPSRQNKKAFGRNSNGDPEDTSRGHEIFSNLRKHTNAFQKFADFIHGREDWTRLAPKPPRAPSVSPDPTSRLQPIDTDKVTISVPPSPFQPSVEDVEESEDEEEEEEVKHNIETYQFLPKDDSPSTTERKAHPRRVVTPSTPPQLVVRQPTDPTFVESQRRRPEGASSPLRSTAGVDDEFSNHDVGKTDTRSSDRLHPSAIFQMVTKSDRPTKTLRELEEEISRLPHEVQRHTEIDAPLSSSERRRSKNRLSVDLGHTDDFLDTSMRRQRASTTTGTERPRSFVEGSSYDPYRSEMPPPPRPDQLRRTHSSKSRQQPSRSPRNPFVATDPHFGYYDEFGNAATAGDMYGTDPRTSLPTVLESSRDGRRPRSQHRSKRSSGIFEPPSDNFHDFYQGNSHAADFPLFDLPATQPPTSTQASTSAQARSRANSRAKAPSPNSKPYVSPRQLHESVNLEPTVREVRVSLDDLFFGTTKRFRVRRQTFNAQTGLTTDDENTLEVPIPRGLKVGSKIKFEGAGDQTPEGTKELHFKLAEKPHPLFTRVDYDLHCTLEITLAEALCGWERTVTTICQREVRFSHSGPTPNTWKDDRAGLGMCKFKNPDDRGDLIASVSIKYPGPLSDTQKAMIRRALGNAGSSPRNSTYAY